MRSSVAGKRIRILAIVALAIAGAVFLNSMKVGVDRFPAIEVETVHYDLGEIEPDAIAEGSIKVYNSGDADLVVSKVTTSCVCTQGAMVDEVIAPGEEGTLRITVDPAKFTGPTSTRMLRLHSNDPALGEREIEVSATVKPGFVLEPERLDFGIVPHGRGAERSIGFRQRQESLITLENEVAGGDDFITAKTIQVEAADRVDPEKMEYDIVVTVSPDTPAGPRTLEISILSSVRGGVIPFYVIVNVAPAE